MTTVDGWTGREARLLRKALRLSIRDFAAHLGIGARTVNNWEARLADLTPLPYMQEVLDTALARATDDVKARFAAATHADVATPASGPLTRGVLVPIVVNGHMMFVPVGTDTVTGGGLGALLDHLATHHNLDATVVDSFCDQLEACPADSGDRDPAQTFGATVGTAGVAVRKVASWVDRRDFGQHVAALVFAAAGRPDWTSTGCLPCSRKPNPPAPATSGKPT